MNPRERKMAVLLGAFILLGGGGFVVYQFLYVPWQQQEKIKQSVEDDIHQKKLQVIAITKELPKLANWRLLSLPADPVLAKREYAQYLQQLMKKCNWVNKSFTPGMADIKQGPLLPGKKPTYTSLTFNVEALADQAGIVQFLQEFSKTPVLHKIKSLTVDKPAVPIGGTQKGQGMPAGKGFADMAAKAKGKGKGKGKGAGAPGQGFADMMKGKKGGAGGFGKGKGGGGRGERLPVRLQVEALIVHGSAKHWTNLTGLDDRLVVLDVIAGHFGGPVGLAQIPWVVSPQGMRPPQVLAQTPVPRNYSDIARALLFNGQPEKFGPKTGLTDYDDVKQFVRLYMITWDSKLKQWEAKLYNQLTNKDVRLWEVTGSGHDTFAIRDDDFKIQLRGTVLKIDERDVYFEADGEIFALHNGDTLADAMWQAVPAAEAKRLGLLKAK